MQSSVFISHSSAKDPAVAPVRDQIVAELQRRQFNVLFDMKLLGGGEEWRPILHRWLGECDGAVILFSPAALKSPWVLKESTILAWRRSLGSRLRVVPVLLGCQRAQVVDHADYKPLDLGNLEFRRLDQQLPAERAAATLADQIVADLAGLQPDVSDVPLREWITDVTHVLGKVSPEERLDEVAELLGINATARGRRFGDLTITVAYQLLHTDLTYSYDAFKKLRQGLGRDEFRQLVDLVVPTWVPVEAAANVSEVIHRPPGRRMLAINSDEEATGHQYLQRATCGKAVFGEMVTVSEVTGADDEQELLPRYERALWRATGQPGTPKPGVLRRMLASSDIRMYVLLKATAAATILLAQDSTSSRLAKSLFEVYQHTIFVFLAREPQLWAASGNLPGLERIKPELSMTVEEEAQAAQWHLERLLAPQAKVSSSDD